MTLLFGVTRPADAQQTQRTPFWSPGRAAEEPRLTYLADGYLRSAGAPSGATFRSTPGGTPEETARAFLSNEARWFYDGNARIAFATQSVDGDQGHDYVRFTQTVDQLKVFSASVLIQIGNSGVEFILSDIMRDARPLQRGMLATTPYINAEQAKQLAIRWAKGLVLGISPVATEPDLQIYDPQVVGNTGVSALAWVLEVSDPAAPFHEVVLVNAQNGKILFHYSLIEEVLTRLIYDANNTPSVGILKRAEGGAATGIIQVDQAYAYLGDTYAFYATQHGRNSIDNNGMILSATVRYCDPLDSCPYGNAFWDGSRMWFGDGFQVDDVTGHELTHGVTQYESGLIYANQSGAMNESFSDMWGEWIDQGNGSGNDTVGAKWLMGEDLGAIRNMADPPAFGDPDRMGSPNYYTGTFDGGGVHSNSGVGNKLAYLLTDGDTFNGYTITGMGIAAAADLLYECQTNLLGPASDYGDLYDALKQAAINLGLSPTQKNNVEMACRAVEIKFLAGATNFVAATDDGVAQIDLSWNNPASPTFTEVRVRRSTTDYPVDPDTDGTLLYQGPASGYTDTAVTIGTAYYYTIWAYHGAEGHSLPSTSAAQAGFSPEHPSEQFTGTPGDMNDLSSLSITYTPDGPDGYTTSAISAFNFPTNPLSGTQLTLGDDDYTQINLSGLQTIPFYGVQFSSVWVSSNGRVMFGALSAELEETLAHHFQFRSLAGIFDDLDPSVGGTIWWEQFADRLVITFKDMPEYGTGGANNFQFELFFNGTFRVTYLLCTATDGIAGISPGGGIPLGFVESDLSDGAVLLPVPLGHTPALASALVIALLAAGVLSRKRVARCSRP